MDRKTFLGAEDSYIMTGSYTIPVVPDVHQYFHFCSFPKKGFKESHVACFFSHLTPPIIYHIYIYIYITQYISYIDITGPSELFHTSRILKFFCSWEKMGNPIILYNIKEPPWKPWFRRCRKHKIQPWKNVWSPTGSTRVPAWEAAKIWDRFPHQVDNSQWTIND